MGSYICVHLNLFIILSFNTISCSLLLITDGIDDCISVIDTCAKRELQLSIINSELPCKNLFHQKRVYMLHDQFDGRSKQKCVIIFEMTLFVTLFVLLTIIISFIN
jgi:hypothetical protein